MKPRSFRDWQPALIVVDSFGFIVNVSFISAKARALICTLRVTYNAVDVTQHAAGIRDRNSKHRHSRRLDPIATAHAASFSCQYLLQLGLPTCGHTHSLHCSVVNAAFSAYRWDDSGCPHSGQFITYLLQCMHR